MKSFIGDLHIHTVLSPCGDLEMSPDNIICRAADLNLDIIGITDHNSTRQCNLIRQMGEDAGILVLCGAEVTSREEVHCLTYFETPAQLEEFQHYLDQNLPDIPNDPRLFGHQVVVDDMNKIIYTEERSLLMALTQRLDEIASRVRRLQGLFIPAHIDRPRFGILGQLGFFPLELMVDAVELSPNSNQESLRALFPDIFKHSFIGGSDAHFLHQMGTWKTVFRMREPSFAEIRRCLHRKAGVSAVIDTLT